jgi:thioredoxin 1
MAGEKVAVITKDNFEEVVNGNDRPVLVDFWASWCNPCRSIAPAIEELAQEYDGKAVVGKVNVDEQGELSAKFRIMSIPTIILFKGGQPVDKIVGARSKSDFAKMLDKNI